MNILQELTDVYHECRSENWDGYGALPVQSATCGAALKWWLNSDLPLPVGVSADPDGWIALEWDRVEWPDGAVLFDLSVSIDTGPGAAYAGFYQHNGARKPIFGTLMKGCPT